VPKRYLVFKWVCYALATGLLLIFQLFVVYRLRIWGLTPCLPPLLVGAAASFEGRSASPFYAAVLGLLWDLTSAAGPFPGFFTLIFPFSAILAAFVTETLLSRNFLGCLAAAALCSALTEAVRVLLLLLQGRPFAVLCSLAAREFVISLPLLLLIYPLFRYVHKKTTIEY